MTLGPTLLGPNPTSTNLLEYARTRNYTSAFPIYKVCGQGSMLAVPAPLVASILPRTSGLHAP